MHYKDMNITKERVRRCRHCKTELVVVGFERRLITRGKDKGLSVVRDLLGCPNKECKKDVCVLESH